MNSFHPSCGSPEPSVSELKIGNENRKYDVIWKEIFVRSQFKDLVTLGKVCRQFYRIQSNDFWIDMCRKARLTLPPNNVIRIAREHGREFDFRFLYRMAKRNKIDPYGSDWFGDIDLEEADGEIMEAFEYSAFGCQQDSPPQGCRITENMPKKCLRFGFFDYFRLHTLKFKGAGIEDWVMDYLRPEIIIEERVAPSVSTPAAYHLSIRLAKASEGHDYNQPIGSRGAVKEVRLEANEEWTQVRLKAESYPFGMREAEIIAQPLSIETDDQIEEGPEIDGMRLADTVIRLHFPDPPHWYEEDEVEDTYKGSPRPQYRSNREQWSGM